MRTIIDESATITISAPADIVRRQFADLDHHARNKPHPAVTFEILEATSDHTHYRQTSRVGPLRVTQEVDLPHAQTGPLVNTITKGQFRGGTITFDIAEDATDATTVTARLNATLTGPDAILGRLARRRLTRTLTAALEEDRIDIESGNYDPSP
jgi:hypothetical protein